MSREPCVSALFRNGRFARTTVVNGRKTRMVGVCRAGTFAAKTRARERKNERSSASLKRDAVEKRRRDAARRARDESRNFEGLARV